VVRILLVAFRIVCYVGLAIVVAGIGSLVLVSRTGVCPQLTEGGISCISPLYEGIANFGMGVLLATAFGFVPAVLAIAGLLFLIRDVWRWWRGGATAT
jgi:hypothetical protein